MSEDLNKQPVVDAPDPTAKPVGEGNDARNNADEFESILNEYETADTKTAASTQPEPKAGADTTKGNDRGTSEMDEVRQFIFRQDMEKTVKSVRGELDPNLFDDALVESWLDTQARLDRRIAVAWANRHANPKQFEKVVDGLGRNFAKKYGKMPDRAATDDREAVAAAVRGASTKAPLSAPPNFAGLTDAAFQAEKDKLFG